MNVLIVGLGSIGQRHVRNLKHLLGDRVRLSAYRERGKRHALNDNLAIEAGVDVERLYEIRIFDDLGNALGEHPDVVFVTNPSSKHLPIALAAAEAGCHLFIEKPLSHNWEHVEQLISVVEKRNIVSYVGCQYRFHPCIKILRRLIDEKALGRVVAINVQIGEYLPYWHKYEDYRQSYAAIRDLGGGVILTQMIHEIDYLCWLFGIPKRVFALGGSLSNLEIDVEDIVSASIEFIVDNGPLPVHIHADYLQRPAVRSLQIIGDEGKLWLDLHNPAAVWHGPAGELRMEQSFDTFEKNLMFIDQLKHFLGCIEGIEKPLASIRDGARSLRVALAVKESLASVATVELSLVSGEI